MEALLIQHIAENRFRVLKGIRQADEVEVPTPYGHPVKNRPNDHLMSQLKWYLEDFLQYPFSPATDRALYVEDALKEWGIEAFKALFDSGNARDWMTEAKKSAGSNPFQLRVSSDDPGILSWPWEALRDPSSGVLGIQAKIERLLNRDLPGTPKTPKLPKDRINILLVTARPYNQDVAFRSVSKRVVDLVNDKNLPVHIEVLRPPTFDRLQERLSESPEFFHILHFDGHGSFGRPSSERSHDKFQSPEGCLVFEDEHGSDDAVGADKLSQVLQEYSVPIVLLNACQSGTHSAESDDPYASVATSLLKSGTLGVVSMSYTVYVRGVQEFVPEFYGELIQSGDLNNAVRKGRKKMFDHNQRTPINPDVQLQDWLVPVVYQQEAFQLDINASSQEPPSQNLPEEALLDKEYYEFVGRDAAFLALERAMRRPPPAILIQGLGGIGKTTLARAFLKWLSETEGLGLGCLWFSFHDIQSAASVMNQIGRSIFGEKFGSGSLEEGMQQITAALQVNPVTIVWDNFESACGIEGTEVSGLIPPEERDLLRAFLQGLRGGKSKVIITSRSEENWLGPQLRYPIQLGELKGEDRWDYAAQILKDLGISVKKDDQELAKLLKSLGGHPLAMQVVLVQFEKQNAGALREALEESFTKVSAGDDATQKKLFSTIEIGCRVIPPQWRPLLVPLSMHQKFVDANLLELMAKTAEHVVSKDDLNRFLHSLVPSGLLTQQAPGIYETHPLLTSYLQEFELSSVPKNEIEIWSRAFVGVMGSLANFYAPKQLHEQRNVVEIHHANFYAARRTAKQLEMHTHFGAITQLLAAYNENISNFNDASRLYQEYASHLEKEGTEKELSAPYHQLGIIAQKQRDFEEAHKWYLKSVAISEKQGNEHGTAITYHQLGMIAQEQRDFEEARKWYFKSLDIDEKQGNEHGAAITYHQLGRIAYQQRDFEKARKWCLKSLAIKEKQGNDQGAAITYHQLGIVAQEQRDFEEAQKWYLKSLAIKEKQGNEHGAASTYHQLGRIAEEQRDFEEARKWYIKSLAIKEKQGNEYGAASTYHQLGVIAQEQRDFEEARKWYLKSLAIKEKQGNEHGAARTYGQLGLLAEEENNLEESASLFIKSLVVFLKFNDPHSSKIAARHFLRLLENAPEEQKAKLKTMWENAGLGPLPTSEDE